MIEKDIFKMSNQEFQQYLDSKEGQELIQNIADAFDQEIEKDPYFFAEPCYRGSCPYNSGYNHDVEMGEITRCEKFKREEENTCKEIEEVGW